MSNTTNYHFHFLSCMGKEHASFEYWKDRTAYRAEEFNDEHGHVLRVYADTKEQAVSIAQGFNEWQAARYKENRERYVAKYGEAETVEFFDPFPAPTPVPTVTWWSNGSQSASV